MSELAIDDDMTARSTAPARAAASPVRGAAISPYLAVAGARDALDWYAEALGARLLNAPITMPDGRIGHAELEIGGAVLMLADEYPEIGVSAPVPGQGTTVTIHLTVPDVDALVERAVAAGAGLERELADYEYGRSGVIRDPFGHRWLVLTETAAPSPSPASAPASTPRQGDLGYASLWVPDVERAARFFAEVLQWAYEGGEGTRSRHVTGPGISKGLWGGEPRSTLFCCFAVDDVHSAVERVREAGGTAEDPHAEPYGLVTRCRDDQGMEFALYQPAGGAGPRHAPPPVSTRVGELAYVTLEVVDSARTRAFFSSVLGWRTTPGRVADGWQVEDAVPMVGLSGGHETATGVPMYRVDDIVRAVDAVLSAGGEATDPEEQPYGISSVCRDDQGTRFYLGQLA